jgi:hypothetical protein
MNKILSGEITDLGNRMVRFCISNEEQDRDGDILRAGGCDFTNFAKNPQFLGFHNSYDFPLGVPKKWWIDQRAKKVYADVYFPTLEELTSDKPENASEKAKLVDMTYNMYKLGMLSAVSVGFRPHMSEDNPAYKYGKIITNWELLEFSAVPLPSNQGALAEACKSFGDDTPMVIEMKKSWEESTKSGRRLSAETMKAIDEIRGCHGIIKSQMEAMEKYMAALVGEETEPEEPEDDTVLDIED